MPGTEQAPNTDSTHSVLWPEGLRHQPGPAAACVLVAKGRKAGRQREDGKEEGRREGTKGGREGWTQLCGSLCATPGDMGMAAPGHAEAHTCPLAVSPTGSPFCRLPPAQSERSHWALRPAGTVRHLVLPARQSQAPGRGAHRREALTELGELREESLHVSSISY